MSGTRMPCSAHVSVSTAGSVFLPEILKRRVRLRSVIAWKSHQRIGAGACLSTSVCVSVYLLQAARLKGESVLPMLHCPLECIQSMLHKEEAIHFLVYFPQLHPVQFEGAGSQSEMPEALRHLTGLSASAGAIV